MPRPHPPEFRERAIELARLKEEAGCRIIRKGEFAGPKMIYTFIARACTDLPVQTCCRVMKVSSSGFMPGRPIPSPTRI
jgi:hypothetical protein